MHLCDFAFLWKMIPHSALFEWHGDIIVGGDVSIDDLVLLMLVGVILAKR